MAKRTHCIVLVTAPNRTVARKIVKSALKKRLIACANLIPNLESIYQWEGKIETGKELLLLIKTTRESLKALEKDVLANHPYDTPEFVVLKIESGNKRYLDWLEQSCAN